MRVIAIVCSNSGLKYNKLIFWNLSSTILFITFFMSSALNVFVIQICPDLTKRVWSVLIILAEVILTIIDIICSMVETYQTISNFFFYLISSHFSLQSFFRVSRSSKGNHRRFIESVYICPVLLLRIINVLPGANMFSEKLISAVKFD